MNKIVIFFSAQDKANLIAAAIFLAIATYFFTYYILSRFRHPKAVKLPTQKVIRDWQPTGNINFVVPDIETADYDKHDQYFLDIQEVRVIELVGGGEDREVRYRHASLAEAVTVVKAYNAHILAYPNDSVAKHLMPEQPYAAV